MVSGESSYIRERARELGLSLRDLADRVGVSYSYMSQVARGHSNMGVKVQARVESALEGPAKVAPAQCAGIDREAMWERMNAHGISQNEVARRAGIRGTTVVGEMGTGKTFIAAAAAHLAGFRRILVLWSGCASPSAPAPCSR